MNVVSRLRWEVQMTNSRIRGELEFESASMLSDDDDLCASIRHEQAARVRTRLTRYREIVFFGGPIGIEKLVNVDIFRGLVLLRPWQVIPLHLDLDAHHSGRRNISMGA